MILIFMTTSQKPNEVPQPHTPEVNPGVPALPSIPSKPEIVPQPDPPQPSTPPEAPPPAKRER